MKIHPKFPMINKLKNIALIFLTCAGAQHAFAQFSNPSIKIEADNTPSDVKSFTVSNDGRYRLSETRFGFDSNSNTTVDGEITLSVNNRLQNIDGFGFAITGSAAYNLMQLNEGTRKGLLTQTFSPVHGYGCSFVRVPIGCSDFSLSQYTCCDRQGIENFSLTDEEYRYIIPILQQIKSINPYLKIIAAPWTAPLWMKTNNRWTGGNLRKECYGDYATYFAKWIEAFRDAGIDIYAVTPQNEPLNQGNSASMYMSWTEARDFIKSALGPTLRQSAPDVKIFVFDHNYNYDNISSENHYPVKIYADAQASQYISGASYHNYGGHASEMTYIHQQYPDKELLFTEWTAGTWSWPGAGIEAVTTDAQSLLFDVINNWGQGSIVWNFLLDSDHGPFRPGGCETANGAVDVNRNGYNQLTFNSFYYVMCIASAAVTPGAKYLSTSGSARDIQILAFENTDGTYGVILMNTSGENKKIRLRERTHHFVASLPPGSITSFRW